MRIRTPWIFTLFAGVYDALTAQERWKRHCREMAGRVPGRRVLDLGIGPGVSGIEMVRAAPATRLVGVDSSPQMVERARRHARESGVPLSVVRADASRLPFADGVFDGVTGHSFLYLLPDSGEALREAHRVLRPGGGIAFLEPNGEPRVGRLRAVARAYLDGVRFGTSMLLWTVFSGLHGRFTRASLAALLARSGFADPRVQPTFGGLGLVAVARRP